MNIQPKTVAERGYWEHFEHQADIGVRGVGCTLEDAFAEAATAMTAIICHLPLIRPNKKKEIYLKEADRELLLAGSPAKRSSRKWMTRFGHKQSMSPVYPV